MQNRSQYCVKVRSRRIADDIEMIFLPPRPSMKKIDGDKLKQVEKNGEKEGKSASFLASSSDKLSTRRRTDCR